MRKAFLVVFVTLLVAESLYFFRLATASLLRIQGEKAYYRRDYPDAWSAYSRALDWGADTETVEVDRLELLTFGMDFQAAGLRVNPALPIDEAMTQARALAASRIAELPYKAYYWGLVADVYFNQAIQARRSVPINLSDLSDEPLGNLIASERLGVAALERAAALEPDNYVYHDLLARTLLERGAVEEAAVHVRRAVAACPSLNAHPDLMLLGLDPRIVEAAVQGLVDASGREGLIRLEAIEAAAGRLLRHHGQAARSVDFLRRAIARAPALCEAHYELGLACSQLGDHDGAVRHLARAGECRDDSPGPHFSLGLAYRAAEEHHRAVEQFRRARAEGGSTPKYFHALGEALEATGAIPEAERQYVAAAHLHPTESAVWRELLGFYARHRDRAPLPEACVRLEELAPGDSAGRALCSSLGLLLQ
jgi:tetratricopeptide (TPR) repeat protein